MIKKLILSTILLSSSTIAGQVIMNVANSTNFKIAVYNMGELAETRKFEGETFAKGMPVSFNARLHEIICVGITDQQKKNSVINFIFWVVSDNNMNKAITWSGTSKYPEYAIDGKVILKHVLTEMSTTSCTFNP